MAATLVVALFAGALTAWVAWTRMRYADKTPRSAMNATLTATYILFLAGMIVGLDLLGWTWFRAQPLPFYLACVASVAMLVWLWEPAPEPPQHQQRRYRREKIERLRDAVNKIRFEWTKFPGGLPESERATVLLEFNMAADDFVQDPDFGQKLIEIDRHAAAMLGYASSRYRDLHGEVQQTEKLYYHAGVLVAEAIEFVNATAHLVIYED